MLSKNTAIFCTRGGEFPYRFNAKKWQTLRSGHNRERDAERAAQRHFARVKTAKEFDEFGRAVENAKDLTPKEKGAIKKKLFGIIALLMILDQADAAVNFDADKFENDIFEAGSQYAKAQKTQDPANRYQEMAKFIEMIVDIVQGHFRRDGMTGDVLKELLRRVLLSIIGT